MKRRRALITIDLDKGISHNIMMTIGFVLGIIAVVAFVLGHTTTALILVSAGIACVITATCILVRKDRQDEKRSYGHTHP